MSKNETPADPNTLLGVGMGVQRALDIAGTHDHPLVPQFDPNDWEGQVGFTDLIADQAVILDKMADEYSEAFTGVFQYEVAEEFGYELAILMLKQRRKCDIPTEAKALMEKLIDACTDGEVTARKGAASLKAMEQAEASALSAREWIERARDTLSERTKREDDAELIDAHDDLCHALTAMGTFEDDPKAWYVRSSNGDLKIDHNGRVIDYAPDCGAVNRNILAFDIVEYREWAKSKRQPNDFAVIGETDILLIGFWALSDDGKVVYSEADADYRSQQL